MNKILVLPVLLALVFVLSFSTQHALAVSTINFDVPSFPNNFDSTTLVNNYVSDGVLFSTDPSLLIFRDDSEAISKNNILVPPPAGMRSGDIVFSTVDPNGLHPAKDANSVSFWLVSIGMNPVTVTVYDKNDLPLYTQTFGPNPPTNGLDNKDFFTFSDPNIRKIVIQGNGQGGDGYGIDDLLVTFAKPQIPTHSPVGGIIVPIDMTTLFVAGAMTNAVWILPTLGGIAGAAITLFKIKRKHN